MRIANIAHSTTDRAGFLAQLIALAKEKGVVGYPGDGANLWNAVHTRDVASLFRLALEKGSAGKYWHAVGDGAIPLREIAEAIGSRLGLPAVSTPADVLMVPGYVGFLANIVTQNEKGQSVDEDAIRAELATATRYPLSSGREEVETYVDQLDDISRALDTAEPEELR